MFIAYLNETHAITELRRQMTIREDTLEQVQRKAAEMMPSLNISAWVIYELNPADSFYVKTSFERVSLTLALRWKTTSGV